MKLLEIIDSNLQNAAQVAEHDHHIYVTERAERIAFLNEQRRLGTPLREKALALIDTVQALVPYDQLVEVKGLFFKRARTQAEITRLKEEKMGISAYGFLDGNPRHVVAITQDLRDEPAIFHNDCLLFSFSDHYPSRVGTRNPIGMLVKLDLNEQTAAEMHSYLDQLAERVQWQEATHIDVRVHGAIARGPRTFQEYVLPEARGDLFVEQFQTPLVAEQ